MKNQQENPNTNPNPNILPFPDQIQPEFPGNPLQK